MYVRHRSRMVRKSVMDDLRDTLTTTDDQVNWIPRDGTDPVMGLLGGDPLIVKEFQPEEGSVQGMHVQLNTLAVDVGTPLNVEEHELGGMMAQIYVFNFAIFATDDAMGQALFQDLSDRYMGFTHSPTITLYNYFESPPEPVGRKMDVESFEYAKDVEQPAPTEASLFRAQLVIKDYPPYRE